MADSSTARRRAGGGTLTGQSDTRNEGAKEPSLIAGRYLAHEILGRGGMGCVYRVTDCVTGRQVALKQLLLAELDQREEIMALFEREFHTLAQLRHPRVIEVYDYGVNPGVGPYYTMELLDGGDMRERSPLPWRETCALVFDVCSSLALLHSRRLLHRDVSPRNIRCTRSGAAKLIDFGAMAPMGRGGGNVVGTPAFTPPEILQRSALDARTDLFSVGATLYYALTRSLAYPARGFGDLLSAWQVKPSPPSSRVPGIPAALDDLVMSLLSLEPSLRPGSAFEVMQRLAAIGDFECLEPEGVARGYLSTPLLVGRDEVLREIRGMLANAALGKGGGLLITAGAGLGRSRMLDACALEAKTLGARVLRAAATAGPDEKFAVARGLVEHVHEALSNEAQHQRYPELFQAQDGIGGHDGGDSASQTQVKLKDLNGPDANPERVQQALSRFMFTLSRKHPLVIVVDDVHRIDAASAAFLASLVDLAKNESILVALTAERRSDEPMNEALQVFAGRCQQVSLAPLTGDQTQALLSSVFGDVTNLQLVSDEIARLAHGNPREIMDVAQHLVDNQLIRYAGGSWTLPSRLTVDDLPDSAEAAIRARIALLQPLSRFMAEAQALAFHPTFTREDYLRLFKGVDAPLIDAAISELLAKQALASDGRTYALVNRVWAAALPAQLSEADAKERHAKLAELYRGKLKTATIHHLFAAGLDEQGFDAMLDRLKDFAQHFDFRASLLTNAPKLAPSYLRALEVGLALGRPPRELNLVRGWLLVLCVVIDAHYYWSAAPAWLDQLKHDSGLSLWQADSQTTDPGERLTRALKAAHERYLAAPETERVYRVDEAIRLLVNYVVVSLAVGARTMDNALLRSLPVLLEPFAPLSKVVDAIWQNAIATSEANGGCQHMRARTRWLEVFSRLDQITGAELQHVESIRNAVAYGLGVCESLLGLASASDRALHLDADPMHRVSALYLRKIVRLEQGDWHGAQRMHKQAEVLGLQAGSPQMFTTLLAVELHAHAQACDLAGLKDVLGRIEPLAAQHEGWVPYRHLALARFELIRGDLDAAEVEFNRCLGLTMPNALGESPVITAWAGASAGLAETLLLRGRYAEARACAEAALLRCKELSIEIQDHDIARLLALADGKLGEHAAAAERLDRVIAEQTELGVTGLKLGLSYEMRAQVALWAGDAAAFQHYARLTAREYRHGAGCPLGARYERLMNEARRSGHSTLPELTDFEPTTLLESSRIRTEPAADMVTICAATQIRPGSKQR